MARPKKTKYLPRNPEKYVGDYNKIICRSNWESIYCKWCDLNPNVIAWNSEEHIVPYICPTDNKKHRYHIDFYIKVTNNGKISEHLIEIKPRKETKPPRSSKNKRRFIIETLVFVKNQAKWAAATRYALNRNMTFHVLDEFALGIAKNGR